MYASHLVTLSDPVLYLTAVKGAQHIVEEIQEHTRIDAIAMRGVSGMAVGFPVCALTGISPVIVRKKGENTHSYCSVECPDDFNNTKYITIGEEGELYGVKNYVIIDDFVCSGETVTAIIDSLRDAKCVGIILYEKIPPIIDVDVPIYIV
jgi:adenine/guanine phosphoribosyltransferase-like PRPP-binding protein